MQEDLGGPAVCVSFTLTFDEYVSALSGLRAERGMWILYAVVLFIAFFIATQLTLWWLWIWIGAIALVFLCLRFVQRWRVRLLMKKWQGSPGLCEPQSYFFSPSGVRICSGFGRFSVDWKFFIATRNAPTFIYFMNARGEVNILPKRAFKCPEDQRTFRQFVEALGPKRRF
jgi:YcxB-like protein